MTTQLAPEGPERPNYATRVNPPQRGEQGLAPIAVIPLCDAACPAEAIFRVDSTASERHLFFCAHHYDAHEPALVGAAWKIQQLRERPS